MRNPRIAFFTDSYLEVNGVARTSREFARFARDTERPFFSVHTGPVTRTWREGALQTYELKASPFVIPLETDLFFDLLFLRHRARLLRALRAFRPDILHVTGPGHIGMLGALLAWQLKIPMVASWHTNVHEFGARRLRKLLRFLPDAPRQESGELLERITLAAVVWFYKFGRVLYAPNPELVSLLQGQTGRPTYLMTRGIDTDLFSPRHRTRSGSDEFVIGYVGRLSPEKNVRCLVEIERFLIAAGIENYRFCIVGDGGDRTWLANHLRRADLPGVLLGERLSEAYANMDMFVFPSETDTFGNVALEALSSGLPTLVSSGGGPKYIIRPGTDGFAASDTIGFAQHILQLYRDRGLYRQMSLAARQGAFRFSWPSVFEGVYGHYQEALAASKVPSVADVSLSQALSRS
jgi:phosphatidylinositol alpha 1,6-mannosyltransferase